MNRVALARVGEGHLEVVVLGARAVVLAAGAARLVVDVEARRGGDVVGHGQPELLLAELLLARLQIGHLQVGVGVVGLREGEVFVTGAFEVVRGHRGLAQRPQRDVAHPLAVERVVDPPILKGGVQRFDLHAVVVAADGPEEIVQRPDRVVEEIGLQRLADPLLLGGIGRIRRQVLLVLPVFVGIVAVEGIVDSVALGLHQRFGVQLRKSGLRECRKQAPEQEPEDDGRCFPHVP